MWWGHFKRMEDGRIPKAVVEWESDGRRREGKPRWINIGIDDMLK